MSENNAGCILWVAFTIFMVLEFDPQGGRRLLHAAEKIDNTDRTKQSTIVYYRPGDAFFYGRLTKRLIEEFKSTKEIRLDYGEGDVFLESAFRGFIGFRNLVATGESAGLRQHLEMVYRQERMGYARIEAVSETVAGEVRREMNGLHLFVVDKSFDIRSLSFGLRYNTNWPKPPREAMKKGLRWPFADEFEPFQPQPYGSFISGEDAVIADWNGSFFVKPLKSQIPEGIAWADIGEPIKEPITVDLTDVKVFVLPVQDLNKYFSPKDDCYFYEVNNHKIDQIHWDAEAEEWETSVFSADAK